MSGFVISLIVNILDAFIVDQTFLCCIKISPESVVTVISEISGTEHDATLIRECFGRKHL
jgi:hypothetical protein